MSSDPAPAPQGEDKFGQSWVPIPESERRQEQEAGAGGRAGEPWQELLTDLRY